MQRIIVAGIALVVTAAAADAAVTRFEITRREPFAAGQTFGMVGSYEKLVGRFHGELDAAHALNAGIVDIDKAPRNTRGRVEYAADFYILKPLEMRRGNGALLYDVNNRGNKRVLIQHNSAPASNDPSSAEHAGNGFLMREGFTVVWSGWIPGLAAQSNFLRLDVPSAPGVSGTVWDEFLFNNHTTTQARLTFKAAASDGAVLWVRERNADEPAIVPAEQWELVDEQTIRLLPAGTPFRIGAIYQLSYRAADPPVAGIGFAATRDLVAFLRRETADVAGTPNPLAVEGRPAIDRALAHGTSQSGRYLRDFVYRGFNEDEIGRIVFDGMNPHVATVRMFLNHRFAQPNRMVHTGHGFMFFPDVSFPYAYEMQQDPFTGKTDGILVRCTERRNCPKLIHTVTSTEYWQSGQSLITTNAAERRDGTPPDNVRIYHFAGTQHIDGATMPKDVCALAPNPVDRRPLLRALLVALDRWVKEAGPPPPSRYPRISDGSLTANPARAAIPGLSWPRGPNPRPRFDYGPAFTEGLIDRVLPVALPDQYAVMVPQVDADGNEIGGIRLPDVAVPIGTATGWGVRKPEAGGGGELCYLDGSFLPFARTKVEREAKGDPRLSLEERYLNPSDYVAKVGAAAAALERDGYLLAEDAQRIVERASAMPW